MEVVFIEIKWRERLLEWGRLRFIFGEIRVRMFDIYGFEVGTAFLGVEIRIKCDEFSCRFVFF